MPGRTEKLRFPCSKSGFYLVLPKAAGEHHLERDHESFLSHAVCRLPASSDRSTTPSLSPPKLRIACPSLEELLSIHGHEKPQELE